MELPVFRCHPLPLQTGSIVASEGACACCGKEPGYLYDGPAYCRDEVGDLCPWCIADGSAHEKFGVEFTDAASLASVPRSILEEVAYRTPGFTGWQQEHWLTCCNDAAAFVGIVGDRELKVLGQEAQAAAGRERGLTGAELTQYLSRLRSDGDMFAVMFRCLHCGKYLAYEDMS